MKIVLKEAMGDRREAMGMRGEFSPIAHRPSPCALRYAFTLIELLIAISIFALVMIAIYSAWFSIVRGSAIGLEAAAAAQRGRIAMSTLEDAIVTAQIFTENIRYYSFEADTSGKFPSLSFTSRLPGNFPGSGLFGDQVVRRLTFSVERGADNENQLIMTQWPLLEMVTPESTPYPIMLAREVTAFDLEFFNPQKREWETEFLETNMLPSLIRITLGLGHSSRNSSDPIEVITRVVAPAAVMVTPQYQFAPH